MFRLICCTLAWLSNPQCILPYKLQVSVSFPYKHLWEPLVLVQFAYIAVITDIYLEVRLNSKTRSMLLCDVTPAMMSWRRQKPHLMQSPFPPTWSKYLPLSHNSPVKPTVHRQRKLLTVKPYWHLPLFKQGFDRQES